MCVIYLSQATLSLLGIVLAVPATAVLQVVLHRWHQA
jgi:predicted PurR-regulated permease PerM